MDPAFLEPRYQPAEVARLLHVSADTVRRWLGSPAVGPGSLVHKDTPTNWASFLDLVELYIAQQLDTRLGIGVRRLRRMLAEAAQREKLDHPLATRRFLLDGGKLWLPMLDAIVDLGTGGQLGLPEIIHQVAKNIDFNLEGIATRWWPEGHEGGIVLDPMVAFGAPVVGGTRINTAVIFDAWEAEDHDARVVATWYDLPVEAVEKAVGFEQRRAA